MAQRMLIFLASVFLLSTAAFGQTDSSASGPPTLEQIDHWRHDGQFQRVLDVLQRLREQRPDDADVLWRLAHTKVDIGEQTDDADTKKTLFHEGMEIAHTAVQADSQSALAHLTLAIAAGRVALNAGPRERVELSRTVKHHADRAIDLDASLDGAYHVRGQWHYQVADLTFIERAIVKIVYGGLPDASFEQAAQNFQHAIDLHDRIVHRLELGRTYIELGDDDTAREHLQRALAMPNDDPDDPAYKEEAQELLDEID